MATPVQASIRSGGKYGLLLAALVLFALATVIFPVFIIRPFVAQNPHALAVALVIKRWAPAFTLLLLVIGVWPAYRAWRRRGERHKALKDSAIVFAVFLLAFSAWAARINVYERMFHPLDGLHFVSATQTKLAATDMVMAVRINGEARAYPVLQMAYHHIANDVVGGEPIAATY